ncbi:hypothetical protein Micbo1qcDRAFT_233037 [Microdochium bolleyi]|uniref:Uncharacterized protein n=1 Tax=Microdochium bolleyi TaxID=196109 RepID=A0A136J8R1_9PEZI|nr:hypothetical protein Micbo1qcDRAFT_233037 [Microdochium bolleyi]
MNRHRPSLAALPYELRREICTLAIPQHLLRAIHIVDGHAGCDAGDESEDQDKQQRRFSVCSCDPAPVRGLTENDKERRSGWAWVPARLASRWGSHWRCEEEWCKRTKSGADTDASKGNGSVMALMRTCRSMFKDVLDLLADAQVHVAGLEVLEKLAAAQADRCAGGSSEPVGTCYSVAVLMDLRRLHITLKVPAMFCTALGADDGSVNEEMDADCRDLVASWHRIGEILEQFPHLSSVDAWIDHSTPEKWCLFNERRIVEPFAAFLRRRRGTGTNDLVAAVHLPFVHPLHENPERHFIDDVADSGVSHNLQIRRFVRQRSFVDRGSPPRTFEAEDFPYTASAREGWHIFPDPRWTPANIVEAERALFRQGVNVDTGIREWKEDMRVMGQLTDPGFEAYIPVGEFAGRIVWTEFLRRHNKLYQDYEALWNE